MSFLSEPGSARQEAEKLVATVLAAATVAANAHPQLSTGSAECCVCPLCKVIAAVRDPDPEMVERIATGAGDLAAGMASFLRTLATPAQPSAPTGDAAWRAATTATTEEPGEAPEPKRVAPKKAAPRKAGPKPRDERPRDEAQAATVVKKTVKKAVKKAAPGAEEG